MNQTKNSLAEAGGKREIAKHAWKAVSHSRHRIYLIIIGLAIAQALVQTFTGHPGWLGTEFGESAHPIQLLLLLATLLTVMHFAQGSSILHLAELTGVPEWQWVKRSAALCAKCAGAALILLRLLFSFRGRLNRSSFWFAILVVGGVTRMSIMLLERGVATSAVVPLLCISVLGLWSCVALQAKRWHDIGLSAWFLLLNLIPVVGQFATLIFIGVKRGTDGNNRFGPDPLGQA